MKNGDESPKRLKLDVETLRHLKVVELDRVVGGVQEAEAISTSRGCNCETDSYNCSRACPA